MQPQMLVYDLFCKFMSWLSFLDHPSQLSFSRVQARAVLRSFASNITVRRRVGPDDVEAFFLSASASSCASSESVPVRGIVGGVLVSQGLDNVMEGIMLPADQDVA